MGPVRIIINIGGKLMMKGIEMVAGIERFKMAWMVSIWLTNTTIRQMSIKVVMWIKWGIILIRLNLQGIYEV